MESKEVKDLVRETMVRDRQIQADMKKTKDLVVGKDKELRKFLK